MQRENPIELYYEGLLNFETQKWNVSTDRARLVDEKNGVIFLVIMFTIWVMVIKCQKWLIFVFSANGSKNWSQFGQNHQVHLKYLNEFVQKIAW